MRPSESSSYAFAFCIFLARLFSQFSTTSSYKYFSGISVLPSSVLSISSFNCEICIFCLTFLRYEIVFHFGLFSLLHSFSLIIFLYFWIFCFCFCFCTSSGLWRAQSFSYTVVYICMYVCMFACGNRYVCKHEVNIEINSVFFFLFDSSESTHSQSDLAAMWTPVATTAISKANAKLHFKFDFFFYLIFWMIFHFPFFGFFYQYILFSTPLVCLPAPWHELQQIYIQTHICICVHVFTCQTHPWIGWQSHWKAMNGGAAVQKHAKLLPSASMWHRPHATNEQTALCGKKLRKTQRIVAKKFI